MSVTRTSRIKLLKWLRPKFYVKLHGVNKTEIDEKQDEEKMTITNQMTTFQRQMRPKFRFKVSLQTLISGKEELCTKQVSSLK